MASTPRSSTGRCTWAASLYRATACYPTDEVDPGDAQRLVSVSRVGDERIELPIAEATWFTARLRAMRYRPSAGRWCSPPLSRRLFVVSRCSAMENHGLALGRRESNALLRFWRPIGHHVLVPMCVLFGRACRRAQASAWRWTALLACSPYGLCPDTGWSGSYQLKRVPDGFAGMPAVAWVSGRWHDRAPAETSVCSYLASAADFNITQPLCTSCCTGSTYLRGRS